MQRLMRITLTGATGFLGSKLARKLIADGHRLHVLGRHQPADLPRSFSEWKSTSEEPPAEAFDGVDAVINLAGEPVAQRWTSEVKRRIRSSRVEGTRQIVNALSTQSRRPRVLINASAVGIYGSRGDEILTEDSDSGDDFLARVTWEWERAALLAEALGIRVVLVRTGLVLSRDAGLLKRVLPPFRFGVGGRLSSGDQWMPWIHIDDWIDLVLFAMEHEDLRVAVNASAPQPVTNATFTRELAGVLHRPAIFPVPMFALKLALGEMADAALSSERAVPKRALAAGFQFRYAELQPALKQLIPSL